MNIGNRCNKDNKFDAAIEMLDNIQIDDIDIYSQKNLELVLPAVHPKNTKLEKPTYSEKVRITNSNSTPSLSTKDSAFFFNEKQIEKYCTCYRKIRSNSTVYMLLDKPFCSEKCRMIKLNQMYYEGHELFK